MSSCAVRIALAALAGGAVWVRRRNEGVQAQVPNLSEGAQCDLEILWTREKSECLS